MGFRYLEHVCVASEDLMQTIDEHKKEAAEKEAAKQPAISTSQTTRGVLGARPESPLQKVRSIIQSKSKTAAEELVEYRLREGVREVLAERNENLDRFLAAASEGEE